METDNATEMTTVQQNTNDETAKVDCPIEAADDVHDPLTTGEYTTKPKVDHSENDARRDSKNRCTSPLGFIIRIRQSCDECNKTNNENIKRACIVIVVFGYLAYFIYAMLYRFGDEGSVRLMVFTVAVIVWLLFKKTRRRFGNQCSSWLQGVRLWQRIKNNLIKRRKMLRRIISSIVAVAIFIYILVDVVIETPSSLISAVGLFLYIMTMFFFSKDPSKVVWRPVLWGLLLQLLFALVVLRSTWGYDAFDWLAKRVTEYLRHSEEGAAFVFGKESLKIFAFGVLPVIVFFSSTISILYYLGWIQVLIRGIAVVMQYSLGTSPMESLHAAFNVFVGWGETIPFLVPFFEEMTLSELHTVMTNGFATVAGSTLVIYHLYGAPANHLLSASVMSAPAALAISKLFYPEDKLKKKTDKVVLGKKGYGQNLFDAASIGAIGATSIVAYILVSVLAFFSLLGFCNATLAWLGERVGLTPPDYPELSFQLICSYLFWPLVFLMGVEPTDCRVAARMVGVKTFINEFFAFEDLGKVIKNGEILRKFNGTWYWDTNGNVVLNTTGNATVLVGGAMSIRSETITSYALCGFSNVTALGIMIGALTAVAPSRKEDIVRVSFRALISGCMACFVTACVAGLLTRA